MLRRVYYQKGEQAVRIAPVRDRRPVQVAQATYGIFDNRFGAASQVVVPTGTAATIDTVSTTLTAKAGGGTDRRNVSLSSTAGIVAGRQYIITHQSSGVAEAVKVAAVVSPTVVLLDGMLGTEYPAFSSFRGFECTALFPASVANDAASIADELVFTIVWDLEGFPDFVRDSIVLQNFEESILATMDDVRRLDSSIGSGNDKLDPASSLAQAHLDVRTEIMLAGADPSNMLLGDLGKQAVVYRTCVLALMRLADEPSRVKAAFYSAQYDRIIQSFSIGKQRPGVLATAKDTATEVPSVANFWKWA